MIRISAHRGGGETAPVGTYAAYLAALEAHADYLEVDIRQTADGTLVSYHGSGSGWERGISALTYSALSARAGYEVPRIADLLQLMAGRAAAHIDLKDTNSAEPVVQVALEVLDPSDIVVTTHDAAAIRALKHRHPVVPVGLTMSDDFAENIRFALRRVRHRGLARLDDVEAAGADRAVIQYRLARPALLADCRKRGIQTMIWTVNGDGALARWLGKPCVDVLVTDQPALAVRLRDRQAAG